MLTLGTPGHQGTSGSLQFCLCPIHRSSQVGLSTRFRTSPHLISVSLPSAAFFPFWTLLLYLLVSGFLFCFDFELGDYSQHLFNKQRMGPCCAWGHEQTGVLERKKLCLIPFWAISCKVQYLTCL